MINQFIFHPQYRITENILLDKLDSKKICILLGAPTKVFTQDYGVKIDIAASSRPLIGFVGYK